jgi:N-acylneuraminate cytidylyltransferase/CMP-N,N'-diacetyllegionaminic acid synthase
MIERKKVLAVIPARGGSKGIPKKNIVPFCGKPLIEWTIIEALKSKYIDKLIVSTDSTEIAEVARNLGAEIPFMRPNELSTDESDSVSSITHTIHQISEMDENKYDFVILLEPTSPLREVADIDGALEELVLNPLAESIVGIARAESQNPAFLLRKNETGYLEPYESNSKSFVRRQEIAEYYYLEGTVYISLVGSLLERNTFYHDKTIGYLVPKWKATEIDDYDDLAIAEALFMRRILGQ